MKKKESLKDKKNCPNCENILEKSLKICNKCGYNVGITESFISFKKNFSKLINEATYEVSSKNKEAVKSLATTTNKDDVIKVTDEGKSKSSPSFKLHDTVETPDGRGKVVFIYTIGDKDGIDVSVNGNVKFYRRGQLSKPKVIDENSKNNPWAICTASVGRKDKKKFEKCIMDVKKQHKLDEDLGYLSEYIERLIMDSETNPKIKKGNFKQFISKLK